MGEDEGNGVGAFAVYVGKSDGVSVGADVGDVVGEGVGMPG